MSSGGEYDGDEGEEREEEDVAPGHVLGATEERGERQQGQQCAGDDECGVRVLDRAPRRGRWTDA